MNSELSRVLITGADGFVGSALFRALLGSAHYDVAGSTRSHSLSDSADAKIFSVGNISRDTDWTLALKGQNVVIHTAAKTYGQGSMTSRQQQELREVNVHGTLNLARQAAEAGVKRFVFLSSVKVNGEQTKAGALFSENDKPNPSDFYGESKLEAEIGLRRLSEETGLEVVIIRPPVVYGPGAKGNFSKLIHMVQKGRPLPLGAAKNKRSFVAIDNLVDLISTCLNHPEAAGHVFLVSDGEDLSTADLVRSLARAADQKIKLLYVPASVMRVSAMCIGKSAYAIKLLGSLQVDLSKAKEILGWTPPVSVEEGLRRCFK